MDDLQSLGFSLVIFPGGIVRAVAKTAGDYYRGLISTGSNEGFKDRMFDFSGLNDVIGTNQMLAQGKTYGD
jgi:2-methylisocitrate lyase-like PEP mutase family enzyme